MMGFADHDGEPTDIVALLLSLLGDGHEGQECHVFIFLTDGEEAPRGEELVQLLQEFDLSFVCTSLPVNPYHGFADIDSTRRMSIRQEVDNGEVESG